MSETLKYTSKFTGEVLPYKTISNVSVDSGIVNTSPDLCRKEDFEPIGRVIARFMRSGEIDKVINEEYAYKETDKSDILQDSAFDVVDESDDVLDQQIDLEDYIRDVSANRVSDSAGRLNEPVTENSSKERAKQSDEQESSVQGSDGEA